MVTLQEESLSAALASSSPALFSAWPCFAEDQIQDPLPECGGWPELRVFQRVVFSPGLGWDLADESWVVYEGHLTNGALARTSTRMSGMRHNDVGVKRRN